MDFKFKKYRGFITIFLIVSSGILILFYNALDPERRLPIYQPSMVNYELVDSTLQHVKKFHKIAPFTLTNQNGKIVTEQDYDNKIYVADFFFTTCPTICIDMGKTFQQVQEVFKDYPRVHLVSHTVMPEIDTVEVMRAYSDRVGAIKGKWHLLTGEKEELYRMARREYFAVMEPGTSFDEHDFIHTENVILVDEKKRIRGFYDGTNEAERIIEDIKALLEPR
jgi:protein SCO1/2